LALIVPAHRGCRLGKAIGVLGIAVGALDNHVQRVADRLGLAESTDPKRIGRALAPALREANWTPAKVIQPASDAMPRAAGPSRA
jgi:endonuclease III